MTATLRLVFTYGRDLPWDVASAAGGPMSGIRSAALSICRALARRGHEVHLFAGGTSRARSEGVEVHDRRDFAEFVRGFEADVHIAIPEILPVLMPLKARARVVWTGNAFAAGDCAIAAQWRWAEDIGRAGEAARLYPVAFLDRYIDAYVAKSHWQASFLTARLGIARGKVRVIYNGLDLARFAGPAPRRDRRRLVYTSEARRGLTDLLAMMPAIRERIPGVELHVFGYEYQRDEPPAGASLAGQTRVHFRGAADKAQLARELRSAAVLAYPCRFKETFCNAVAEAQAAGLPVVTTDLAALPERVSDGIDGFLISGRPGDEGYRTRFVDAVVQLLSDGATWRRMSRAARARAFRDYALEGISGQWEEHIGRLVAGRDATAPAIDPGLDFLDPKLLTVSDRGHTAKVPPELAAAWVRTAWAAYGFEPDSAPGLGRAAGGAAWGRSSRG